MKKERKHITHNRILFAVKFLYLTLVIISLIIVFLYIAFKVFVSPPPIDNIDKKTTVSQENEAPETSISKKERKDRSYTFLLVASDKSGALADVIMLVNYDVLNQNVGMVSIPRDTLVDPNHIASFPKINSSYKGDITNIKAIVTDMLGIPIDFYITVDIDGFVKLIDSIGGVDFNVPVHMAYDDPAQNLSIHYEPGMQHLTGQQALEVCRLRYNQDGTLAYADYDVGRTNTQRALLMAVAKKVLKHPEKIQSYTKIWTEYVDTDLTIANILWFAEAAMHCDLSNSVKSIALPGDGNVTCDGIKYCYQLYPDQVLDIINEYINPYTQDLALNDLNIYQVK